METLVSGPVWVRGKRWNQSWASRWDPAVGSGGRNSKEDPRSESEAETAAETENF